MDGPLPPPPAEGALPELPAGEEGAGPVDCATAPALGDERGRRHEDSAVLKLKGLPYTTTDAQIAEFFEGYSMKQVSFVYDPDGRPSGLVRARSAQRPLRSTTSRAGGPPIQRPASG
jgi:hypothetical protein